MLLYPDSFINAMKGEDVLDSEGENRNFLTSSGEVILENIEVEFPINISGETFKHIITFKNVVLRERISFQRCSFDLTLYFEGGEYFEAVSFNDVFFANQLKLQRGTFHKRIYLSHIHIQQEFIVLDGSFLGDFQINGGVFERTFSIYGGEFSGNFSITSKSKINNFHIEGGHFKKHLILYECIFDSNLTISKGNFWLIFIQYCRIERFSIGSPSLSRITFTGGSYIRYMSLNEDISYTLEIRDQCVIADLNFSNMITNNGNVYITDIYVIKLAFNLFINRGGFFIQYLHRYRLQKKDLTVDYSEFMLFDTSKRSIEELEKKEGQIIFSNSSLGNMMLLNIDFEAFDQIMVNSCKINEITVYGNHFPIASSTNTPVVCTDMGNENYTQNPEHLYDLYNQLYLVMQKQGHRVNEMRYYAAFMEWHRIFLKTTKQDWGTRASLYFNKITNNYEQNWWQPAIYIPAIGFVFFFLFSLFFPSVKFGCEYMTRANLDFWASEYIEFLNPVHRIDFVKGISPGFLSSLCDAVGRILISLCLYQTITAFRRFGRK